jgi:acetyl-CoA carboxylase, biotin carboxylase subunit
VNAEDPYDDFLPSTGTLTMITPPTGPGVRVDTGVYPGFEISPYYDSLISKVICSGETRGEAILRMRRALEAYRILGIKTNIPFHQSILDSPRFIAGQYDTRFVEERFSLSEAEEGRTPRFDIAVVMAALVAHREGQQASQIIRRGGQESSNWKWSGRASRMRQ